MEFECPPESNIEYETVKCMVEKQTKKTLTLKRQFEQHKNFIAAENQSLIPQNFKGFHSLPELKLAQNNQDEINTFKLAGLSAEEIDLYLQYREKKDLADIKLSNVPVEPTILTEKLEQIKLKLELFHKPEQKEKEADCQKVSKDPFYYVAQLSKRIDNSKTRQERKRAKRKAETETKTKTSSESIETLPSTKQEDKINIDTSLYHVAVPLEESEIIANRISLEEIRRIDRFKDYSPGNPSNVLYIKNLHPKIDIRELVSLFGRFDSTEEPVQYRILNGRMKGQAFVTFRDNTVAEEAFQLVNGYKLRSRPMIIEYSRKIKNKNE